MSESAISARQFIQRLSELAIRLAERDIVVDRLDCMHSHFGSWMLIVAKGHDAGAYRDALLAKHFETAGPNVLRVWWDGREHVVTIESSPTRPLSAPNQWTRLLDKPCENSDAAIHFVEDHLACWANGEA